MATREEMIRDAQELKDLGYEDQALQILERVDSMERWNPTNDMSGTDKFLAGTGKGFVDLGRGVGQLIGIVPQADIDAAKERDSALMQTGAGIGGNIVGMAAPFLTAPVTGIPAAIGMGAAQGALQPVASDESRTQNAVIGGVGGGLGAGLSSMVSKAVKPALNPLLQKLFDEGVQPTAAQTMGRTAANVEESLTSLPIVGDMIKGAQRNAIGDFNKAAWNRALSPLGESVPDNIQPGEGMADYVHKVISDRYNSILPHLSVQFDQQLGNDLRGVMQMADNLPDSQKKAFESHIMEIVKKFKQGVGGDEVNKIDSKLGMKVRSYGKSPDPDQRDLGHALGAVQDSIRDMIERQNPSHADSLQAVRTAFATALRPEVAAAKTGAKEGVFTPAQLNQAVRELDNSIRKNSFARGGALMQDLATAGESILSKHIPDSGTTGRALAAALATNFAGFPKAALGIAAAAGIYSKPGQILLRHLIGTRPAGAATVASGISRLSPYLARLSSSASVQASRQIPKP